MTSPWQSAAAAALSASIGYSHAATAWLGVLQALRIAAERKRSVVFVLTTSALEEDQMAAYNAQIAGYLLKSKVNAAFLDFIKLLNVYPVMVELPY